MAKAATAEAGGLSSVFGHVAKHVVIHALWMVPMAIMMMPTPALAGGVLGSFEMIATSYWDFFFDGGLVDVFNNTMSGDLIGSYEWGSMDMSAHAAHAAPASEPVLSDSAKRILGMD